MLYKRTWFVVGGALVLPSPSALLCTFTSSFCNLLTGRRVFSVLSLSLHRGLSLKTLDTSPTFRCCCWVLFHVVLSRSSRGTAISDKDYSLASRNSSIKQRFLPGQANR